jgi:hypothetical protein
MLTSYEYDIQLKLHNISFNYNVKIQKGGVKS